VICWPFDHGTPDVGMGAGAAMLAADAELHAGLAAAGWAPTVQRITAADPETGEAARIFDLLGSLSGAVRAARTRGAFPLVLAGGCISATGTVAGAADGRDVGAVWLDAHADLDTPDDNASGSMDVMALSILCGNAWPVLRARVQDITTVPEREVALLGVRDLADHQRARVERSSAQVVPGAFSPAAAAAAIATLPEHVYLHIDLDVLDTSVGHANRHASSGGPSLKAVLSTIDTTFDSAHVIAAAVTAYEPPSDRDGSILAAARTITARIAHHAGTQI
jgi:arginase